MRARALALVLAIICSGCANEHGAPRPPPRAVGLSAGDAAQLEALDLRTLSAGQLLALDHQLHRCLVQVGGAAGLPAAARFRTCAFRELAHNSISQRFNAMLALTLTRRLRGGNCRANLLAFAGVAQIVAVEAESMLRELNGLQTWTARQRAEVRALRSLARDTRARLASRAWRRDCGHPEFGQLVE